MVAAIERYLTEKEYRYSIIGDGEFKSSKEILEGKARLLRQQGKSKRPNKVRGLTTTEENELWENGSCKRESLKFSSKQFGGSWPIILALEVVRNTTAWRSTIHLSTGWKQHAVLRTHRNPDIPVYPQRPEDSFQKCLLLEDRCPVTIFKEFLSRRLPEIRTTCPLCLSWCQMYPRKFGTR